MRNKASTTAASMLTQPEMVGASKSLFSDNLRIGRAGYARARTGYKSPADRGASFVIPVPDSEYRGLRSWTSREAWLTAVQSVLHTPEGEALRCRISIRRKTFLRFCEVEADSAHRRHGRHVATSHETLAQRLGMSKITARRARQLMGLLDCSVTLRTGRNLTVAEGLAATESHGGRTLVEYTVTPEVGGLAARPPPKRLRNHRRQWPRASLGRTGRERRCPTHGSPLGPKLARGGPRQRGPDM